MKTIATLTFIFIAAACMGQSKSFTTLREEFRGGHDVFAFRIPGFFARGVLHASGEHEYVKAIKDIRQIRVITIPASEFRSHRLTIEGYKRFVLKDDFEEVADVRDHGDKVTVYLQGEDARPNCYLMLVEDGDQFVAIEIKGYIDTQLLLNLNSKVAYTQ